MKNKNDAKPIVSAIVACDQNRAIGFEGDMPWHIPEDLAYFKRHTLSKPVVMGRKTFESLPFPLPQRDNIIITSQPDYDPTCVHEKKNSATMHVVSTIDKALDIAGSLAATSDDPEIMVVGGAQLYEQLMPVFDRLYITEIATKVAKADRFFPNYLDSKWRCTASVPQHSTAGYALNFKIFNRV